MTRIGSLTTDDRGAEARGVNATELFDNRSDPAQADPVVVTSGGLAVTVDAALQP